jgi:uncharacterized RDD family membrane protein YckC
MAVVNIQKPPGLLRRLGALFYDSLLLLGLLFLATLALLVWRGGTAFGPADWLGLRLYLLGFIYLFFAGFWTYGGQTLGMRAWKLRLCSATGGAVSWPQASLRFVAALVSLGAFGLGFCWALGDAEKRCWHDRIAGTRLVRSA